MSERVAVLLCGLLLVACADAHDVDAITPNLRDDDAGSDEGRAGADDDDARAGRGGRGGRGGSGAGAGGGASGSGGSGTSGTGGGGSGTSGGATFGDVSSCQPCRGAEGSMGALEPCCTADGACGLDIGELNGLGPTCARQNARGTESSTCPSYVFGTNFELTSCCGEDGFCGVMIMQTAPLGCVDARLLGDLVSPADDDMGGGMFFGGGFDQGRDEDDGDGPVRCTRGRN